MIRRAVVVVALLVAPVAGSVASAQPAVAQEPIREPLLGACIRPLIGEGGILNLPLIDIPGQRIPNQSIELTVGGQYRECKV